MPKKKTDVVVERAAEGPPVYPPLQQNPPPERARYILHNGGRVEFVPVEPKKKAKEVNDG